MARYARTLDVNPTQHKFFFQPKLSYPLSQDLYALLEMAKIRICYKQNTTNIIMISSSNVPQMALIAFRNHKYNKNIRDSG